jgi:hypothetical protein
MSNEERIKELKKELESIDRQCSRWKDSGDRGACYAYNKYNEKSQELKRLKGEK